MGLEIVEMIMAIEDEFDIELQEDEVQPIETVWQMHELVCRKLGVTPRRTDGTPSRACPSSRAFYHLRSAMVETLGVERRSIAPATPLSSIPDLRTNWRRVAGAAAIDLPYPGTLSECGLTGFGWAIVVGTFFWAFVTFSWLPLLLAAPVVAALLVLERCANRVQGLPPDYTMRELTRMALGRNPQMFGQAAVGVYPSDVWERMVGVIAEEIQYPIERIVPDTRFVQDMQL